MKTKTTYFSTMLLAVIVVTTGCRKEPQACFNYHAPSYGTIYTGESIKFDNCSENAHAWNWNFGDSSVSSEQHPTHTFDSAGTYQVTLKVYSKGDMKTSEISEYVVVEKTIYEKLADKWDIHTKEIDYTSIYYNDTTISISGWIDFITDSTVVIFDPDSTNNDSLRWTYEGTSPSFPYGIKLKIGDYLWNAYLDNNNTELSLELYFSNYPSYWFKYHCNKN